MNSCFHDPLNKSTKHFEGIEYGMQWSAEVGAYRYWLPWLPAQADRMGLGFAQQCVAPSIERDRALITDLLPGLFTPVVVPKILIGEFPNSGFDA